MQVSRLNGHQRAYVEVLGSTDRSIAEILVESYKIAYRKSINCKDTTVRKNAYQTLGYEQVREYLKGFGASVGICRKRNSKLLERYHA